SIVDGLHTRKYRCSTHLGMCQLPENQSKMSTTTSAGRSTAPSYPLGSWQSRAIRAKGVAKRWLGLGVSALGLQRRPSFLIIGAMKCGTISLHNYLTEHPELRGAEQKEISYFDQNVNYQRGLVWYHSQFPM